MATNQQQTTSATVDAMISRRLFGFIYLLRDHGFLLSADEINSAHVVLTKPLIQSQSLLHHSLRSIFCQSKAQWQEFTTLFIEYWQPNNILDEASSENVTDTRRLNAQATGLAYFSESHAELHTQSNEPTSIDVHSGGAGDAQTFAQRDFRFVFNPHDMRRIEKLVDDISRRMQKRLRRRARQHRSSGQLDLRRTTRTSLRHSGWPFELRFLQRQRTPARFLLLLDVSQSMEIYSYLFLRFARGILQAFKDTDAYAFHTELVPIGHELKDKSTQRLEGKLKELSSGWLGGTRISESLKNFNQNHANHKVHKNTVVIIFSDGYDSGEPDQLAKEVQHLKTQCRKLVWVNPLLGRATPNDKPLPIEKSLYAAIPHVDLYTSAHNLSSLKNLEAAFRLR